MALLLVLCAGVRAGRALDPQRSLSEYGRQTWGTDTGLPQNTVRAVTQTPDGYLWVATDEGLVRFDGVEFRVFLAETTPELRSSAIEGLTVDQAGRLWVVTQGGLAVEASGRFRAVGVGKGLPSATVWFAHLDRRGRLWVSTAGGLCVMDDLRCVAVSTAQGLSVRREGALAEGMDGSMWVADGGDVVRVAGGLATRMQTASGAEVLALAVDGANRLVAGTEQGLQVDRGGALVPVGIDGVSERVAVTALLRGKDGRVWVGTAAGIAHEEGTRFALVAGGLAAPAQTLAEDREGALWVGTASGVERVAGGRVERPRSGDALAESSVLTTFEDREGDVWVGTETEGLTVLRPQRFSTYTTAEGLSGNVVRAVLEDATGGFWVGTDGAGVNHRTATGWEALSTRQGLSSNVVLSLAAGTDGDVWVGTPTGLNRVRGRTVRVFTTAEGLADDYIRSLLVDRAGDLWVGTRHGLTRRSADGAMTTYTTLDGLGSDFVGVMVEGRNGDLWIGTAGGLTRRKRKGFVNFPVQPGLTKDVVTAIHEGATGELWLGTNGGGLWRMRDGVMVPVPASNLPGTISSVLGDADGNLWIGARTGVYRVSTRELERVISAGGGDAAFSSYDTADGMRVRECSSGGHPAAVRMRDGKMWFATLRGVTVVDPEHLQENKVVPPVAIEQVLVNDVPQQPAGDLVLAPGPQRVEFQYAGLSFVAPGKVEYRYWLQGFDRYWIEAGSHRAAFYTNLRPGRYVFHVAAANNDGVWSETDAMIALRVRPFFWQTWWFYAGLLLLAAAIAYWIYAQRVRQVRALYAGVMEERGRIAREIHDTLAQGIVSISLQLEVIARLLTGSSEPRGTEAAKAQLDVTRSLVRQSLADARSSIWELREGSAEELPVRVGQALKIVTEPAGIAGKMQVTGTYRVLARPVEDEILRIAQEAATNAVRHGDCSVIEVLLLYEMRVLRLEVRDNGTGFDVAAGAPAGHFGLQGMRERAAKIRGHLSVSSEAGEGTEVRLELPLV